MLTSNSDIEIARFNMIEHQIRPRTVFNPELMRLYSQLKREVFVPEPYRRLAFSELEIPLGSEKNVQQEKMLTPSMEVIFAQLLHLKPSDEVLHIGTGSGFFAALIATQVKKVISVEISANLAQTARTNLSKAEINNVEIKVENGLIVRCVEKPVDAIVLTGSVAYLPKILFDQLKIEGRLLAAIGLAPLMKVKRIERFSRKSFGTVDLFETQIPPLNGITPNFSF